MEKVIVFGTGKETESFLYWNYTSTIHKYQVDFYVDFSPRRDTFRGKSVFSATKGNVCPLKQFGERIVVTTPLEEYAEVVNFLCGQGLNEFEDFVYYMALQKKTAILFGNCQMMKLGEYLMLFPEFFNQYWIYPYNLVTGERTLRYIADNVYNHCKLFIYQNIREGVLGERFSTSRIVGTLPKDCIKIRIPNLYRKGFGFFPQSAYKANVNMRDTESEFVVYVDCQDRIIREKYFSGATVYEIEQELLYGNPIPEDEVLRNFNDYMDQIQEESSNSDVKIYEYIRDHYKTQMIFTDPGHFSKNIYYQYLIQILERLSTNGQGEDQQAYTSEYIENILKPISDNMIYPIYGCVARALKLEWWSPDLQIKQRGYTLSGKPLSIGEYVRQYVFLCVDWMQE